MYHLTDDRIEMCREQFDDAPCRVGRFVQVLAAGLVLLVEGGQWFWPPVRVGFVRDLPGTPYQLPGRMEYDGTHICILCWLVAYITLL